VPTMTFSSRGMFNSWSTSVNPNGLSFAAQPPVFANDVRLQLLCSAIVVTPSSTSIYKKTAQHLQAATVANRCWLLSTIASTESQYGQRRAP
jgi:hypothetical protein